MVELGLLSHKPLVRGKQMFYFLKKSIHTTIHTFIYSRAATNFSVPFRLHIICVSAQSAYVWVAICLHPGGHETNSVLFVL